MDKNICAFIAVLVLMTAFLEFAAICNVSDRIDNLRLRMVVLETKVDILEKVLR